MGEGWYQNERVSDVVCPMYATIADIVEYAEADKGQRPLILCEYSHAMGNSNGSLADLMGGLREISLSARRLHLGIGSLWHPAADR